MSSCQLCNKIRQEREMKHEKNKARVEEEEKSDCSSATCVQSNDKMLGMNSGFARSFLTSAHSTLLLPSMIATHSRVSLTLAGGRPRFLISSTKKGSNTRCELVRHRNMSDMVQRAGLLTSIISSILSISSFKSSLLLIFSSFSLSVLVNLYN